MEEAISLGTRVFELLGGYQTIDEDELTEVKAKVQEILLQSGAVDKAPDPIYCCVQRIPDAKSTLPLQGYDIYAASEVASFPRYRIKVKAPDGEVPRIWHQTDNKAESLEDIEKQDESQEYPIVLDKEWEIRWDGARAFLFNTLTRTCSDLKLKYPKHNGKRLPENLYNISGWIPQFIRSKVEGKRAFMRFFRLPHFDHEGRFAVVIARHYYGIDLIPCLVSPQKGRMVITDFAGIYDYPEPLAGKVSQDGSKLQYRFHTDEPLEKLLYCARQNIAGVVTMEDFSHYKVSNQAWKTVIDEGSFRLKPLLRLGHGVLAINFTCDECGEDIPCDDECHLCTQCFDYSCCANCKSGHDPSHELRACKSAEELLATYTISL